MKPRFDAILIDFYGTICAGDREAVERACARIVKVCRLTVTANDFAIAWGRRFFNVIDESNHSSFRTLYECEIHSLETTLVDFGVDADPVPLVAELEAYWRDPPIYGDAIEFLRSNQLPICCVSNADTEPLLAAIEKHELRFDAIVSSEEMRCYKPQAKIFLHALTTLGIAADRAVHIGDSLHSDITGANAVGLTSVWVHRESRIHDIGESDPTHTIGTLAEISDLPRH